MGACHSGGAGAPCSRRRARQPLGVPEPDSAKYKVLPIDDRSIERLNAKLAGRPDLMGDRTSLDDAADVGIDEGTPVTEEYKSSASGFTGKILKIKWT